jgi:hypothetical protein
MNEITRLIKNKHIVLICLSAYFFLKWKKIPLQVLFVFFLPVFLVFILPCIVIARCRQPGANGHVVKMTDDDAAALADMGGDSDEKPGSGNSSKQKFSADDSQVKTTSEGGS